MFKKGDKVVCVRDAYADNYGPQKGRTYEVEDDQEDEYLDLLGIENGNGRGWFADRFILAPAETAPEPGKLYRRKGSESGYTYTAKPITVIQLSRTGNGGKTFIKMVENFNEKFEEIPPAPVYAVLSVSLDGTRVAEILRSGGVNYAVHKNDEHCAYFSTEQEAEEYVQFKKAQEA